MEVLNNIWVRPHLLAIGTKSRSQDVICINSYGLYCQRLLITDGIRITPPHWAILRWGILTFAVLCVGSYQCSGKAWEGNPHQRKFSKARHCLSVKEESKSSLFNGWFFSENPRQIVPSKQLMQKIIHHRPKTPSEMNVASWCYKWMVLGWASLGGLRHAAPIRC